MLTELARRDDAVMIGLILETHLFIRLQWAGRWLHWWSSVQAYIKYTSEITFWVLVLV